MKHNFFSSVFFVTAALCSTACTKNAADDAPQPVPTDSQTINIDAGSDVTYIGTAPTSELKLIVISESDWQLTVSDTRANIDWIVPSSINGKAGESSVILVISENTSQHSRAADIRLTNKSSRMTFTDSQQHYDPANLTLSINKFEAGSEATSQTFTLESSLNWTLDSSDESFCTVSPIRGKAGAHTITLFVTANTSTDRGRTATLTARSGYETATIKVTQERKKPELNIDRGIKTLDDLCRFRDAVNAGESLSEWKYNGEINLLSDIDLSYFDEWQGIGSSKHPFTETFNGNGFSIKNMKITTSNNSFWNTRYGFFWMCEGGIIKNLVLENANSNGYGICGSCTSSGNYPAKIINCTVSGYVQYAPFGFCSQGDYSEQSVYITDCTNKSLTNIPICFYGGNGDGIVVSSCANEGIYCDSRYDDFTDDGYKVGYELFQVLAEANVYSTEDFVNYVNFSLENLSIEMDSQEISVNDKFLELASNSQSIKELYISNDNYYGGISQMNQFTEIIDMFTNITRLECSIHNSYGSNISGILYNTKPRLETLIIRNNNNTHSLFLSASPDETFPALKRLEVFGCKYPMIYMTSTCKELVVQNSWLEKLTVDGAQLEYIDVHGCQDLINLDVSKTNLINSTYEYPLNCQNCGSEKQPMTLSLKTGWEINGINKNINYHYIDSWTIIDYVD